MAETLRSEHRVDEHQETKKTPKLITKPNQRRRQNASIESMALSRYQELRAYAQAPTLSYKTSKVSPGVFFVVLGRTLNGVAIGQSYIRLPSLPFEPALLPASQGVRGAPSPTQQDYCRRRPAIDGYEKRVKSTARIIAFTSETPY